MDRLDSALAQVGNHPVDIFLGHPKRDVVLGRLPVCDCIYTEQSKHPSDLSVRVKEQSARPTSFAERVFESELLDVEVNGTIYVRDRDVDLI